MNTEEHQDIESEEAEQPSEPIITTADKERKFAPAAMFVVLVAIVCLAVVLWFIFSLWTMPTAEAPVVVEETPTEVTEPTPVETVEEDPTDVPDRDPAVLGLRIDTVLGRLFVKPSTGNTLYVTTSECVEECLADWTPYLADVAVVDGGDFGTVERTDSGELQYTWKGSGLYLFNADTNERSALGDGYGGTWRIARP